jgi:hypothetical protein
MLARYQRQELSQSSRSYSDSPAMSIKYSFCRQFDYGDSVDNHFLHFTHFANACLTLQSLKSNQCPQWKLGAQEIWEEIAPDQMSLDNLKCLLGEKGTTDPRHLRNAKRILTELIDPLCQEEAIKAHWIPPTMNDLWDNMCRNTGLSTKDIAEDITSTMMSRTLDYLVILAQISERTFATLKTQKKEDSIRYEYEYDSNYATQTDEQSEQHQSSKRAAKYTQLAF